VLVRVRATYEVFVRVIYHIWVPASREEVIFELVSCKLYVVMRQFVFVQVVGCSWE